MTSLDVLTRLGVADAEELFSPFWEASAATLPEVPDFLTPASITAERQYSGLGQSLEGSLLEVASLVTASPDLQLFAWHCQRLLFDELTYDVSLSRSWPEQIGSLGDRTALLYLLIGLSAIPRMRRFHADHGVPAQVTQDTCTHFPAAVERFRMRTGVLGFGPEALYWLRNHTRGMLYCLGRLEYMLKPFGGPLTAWRHRSTARVLALAAAGNRYDAEGLVAAPDREPAWTSVFTRTEDQVTGTPIAPTGYAQQSPMSLSLSDWELVLSPGDLIYEVHIPEGGGMTPDACLDSMKQATEFFPRYFPGQQAAGFACSSWILNPELEQIYRADSNIVKWQRELYLYPTWAGTRSGLSFIFGSADFDLATAPRDTSLRRALLDQLAADGRLIGGGMFLLLEDFEGYGEQVYRNQWAATRNDMG